MTVAAPAKVNLTLEVLGKRADGFHAIRSVVMPVSLADELEVDATDDGQVASDTGYGDDLCVRAALALKSFAGLAPRHGASIRVRKRIPAGGGLGGGSADAAAVLRALNALWDLRLSPEQLAETGAAVGSDVPALVLAQHYGRPVLMEGRGEIATVLPEATIGPLHLVLANPGVFSSTPAVYGACTPACGDGISETDRMIEALAAGSVEGVASNLRNDLQPPAIRLQPQIGDALAALLNAGAKAAMMSGSGATVFALADCELEAGEIASRLDGSGLRIWIAHVLTAPLPPLV